ncbi:MAG: glycosyltransferase [Acidimicrobiales bacterium]
MPEEFVPPVVAVVVLTGDAGPALEECVESLSRQDYPALDVLVLDASAGDGVTNRVATVMPGAFVRREEPGRGFAQVANQALTGVDGASFFLFCGGDASFEADAVRCLVAEAFRSNASIVGPKLVDRVHPDRLLEVGLGVDRLGSAVSRVEEGELDQAQHDEVREVFAVPSTGLLARADLFEAIGGFDPDLEDAGQDIDICWRARLAAARVVVAPQAVVRWERPPATSRLDPGAMAARRAGEMRAVLKNYGVFRRLLALLKLFLLLGGDSIAAPLSGSGERARARRVAWRWNKVHRQSLGEMRKAVHQFRQVNDSAVVAAMSGRGPFRRVTRAPASHGGADAVAGEPAETAAVAIASGAGGRHGGGLAKHDSDRLTDLVVRLQHGDVAAGPPIGTAVLALIVLVGLRGVVFGDLPVVGQLVPGQTGWHLVGQYLGGAGGAGWGGVHVVSPAYALVGVLAGILGNSYSLAIKVLYLSGLVLGAIGTARLIKHLSGSRSRLVAALAFVASPLVWNVMAHGDLQASSALATLPFVMLRLARAGGMPPFAASPAEAGKAATGYQWHFFELLGEVVPLGLLLALAISLAPAFVVDYGVVLAAGVVSSLLLGGRSELHAVGRTLVIASAGLLVAFACCLPWSLTWFEQGARLSLLTGAVPPAHQGLDPAQLLRGFTGPVGHWWGAFGLVAAGFAVLLWARRPRLDWAARWILGGLLAVLVAWLGNQGMLGAGFGEAEVLLAPATVAFAACCGLGLAAFEQEVSQYRFGWRQLTGGMAVLAFVVGLAPVAGVLAAGRSDLPGQGYEELASEVSSPSPNGYSVLWLGDPRTIPGSSWQISPGLAASVTSTGTPSFGNLYAALSPGRAIAVGAAVDQARSSTTFQLGSLLARYGVRDIVLPTAEAPVLPGEQYPPRGQLPVNLVASLDAQTDLSQLPEEGGVLVFANADWTVVDGTGLVAGTVAGPSPAPRGIGVGFGLLATALAISEGLFRRRRLRGRRTASRPAGERDPAPAPGHLEPTVGAEYGNVDDAAKELAQDAPPIGEAAQ